MCGIFGAISDDLVNLKRVRILAEHSMRRGRDSSGLIASSSEGDFRVLRSDLDSVRLLKKGSLAKASLVIGHSRLVTNGMVDNQPVVRDDVAVFHNGIVVNHNDLWDELELTRELEIDTEIIAALAAEYVLKFGTLKGVSETLLERCDGSISCVIIHLKLGEIVLFSNTGSLYVGCLDGSTYFASEANSLFQIGVQSPVQVLDERFFMTHTAHSISFENWNRERSPLVHSFNYSLQESNLLEFNFSSLLRCAKCVLPSTMPFIRFNESGVCNYCENYVPQNQPKPVSLLASHLEKYRRSSGAEAIMPFSGGRDSSYALHLITKELNMKTIAYTYDWGMVTDLGRRNISRMCARLGVENIVVAADLEKKRKNITRNLNAWLDNPHLGMISILTAGDKHFFKYVESVKEQTGIGLNLWGINPLETTHFKSGYLGIAPDFEMQNVYSSGLGKQLAYQKLRFREMLKSPRYFNASLWDTLSGEYYRSIAPKTDYFHIFDYWRWDEGEINDVLVNEYDWELSPDTSTTWRIGDGTAAFYNYVYFTVGGFSEHETFRSNQIREGEISREKALELVALENIPRYEGIKWYLDAVGLDFQEVINVVNAIPKLYEA
jgi:asparagine synthetase B (glutamine-hydrolysing)